jgi:NADH dehydrogenase (ubiquinone) Fe-S protein 1
MNNSYITINDKKINIIDWSYTILQVCEQLSISIPRFCYHKDLSIAGNCRMCLVEMKNSVKPIIACATALNKEMVIFTNSELVKIARENIIEFLLINHPLDCPICDQGGECDLQDQAMIFGSDRGRFMEIKRSVSEKFFGPVIKTVMTRCIHCTRCVRYAEEIIGVPVLGTMGRGMDTEIGTYVARTIESELTGNLIDLCPVGALTNRPYAFKARSWELEHMEALDILDSLGSYIRIDVKGNELLRVLPRRNDRLNKEWITDKIRFYYQGATVNRLTFPLYRIVDFTARVTLNHCSSKFAFMMIGTHYLRALKRKTAFVSYLGGHLDVIENIFSRQFTNQLDFHLFYIDSPKKNRLPNLRYNWLLNSSVETFVQYDHFIFLNVNLKYECSVLNVLLLQNINEVENIKLYYIGYFFKNIYVMNHISLGIFQMNLFYTGKHYFCFNLLQNKYNFVESGIEPLFTNAISDYVNTINFYSNKNHTFSYVAFNSTELNAYEVGISNERIENKKYSFFYMIGNSEHTLIKKPKCHFSVFQAHHFHWSYHTYFGKYHVYLPVSVFHEVSSYYETIPGWLNNQLIYTPFIDKIVTPPGEAKSNLYYFYCILYVLFLHIKKTNDPFMNKHNEVWDQFDEFEFLYEFDLIYDQAYIPYISIINNNSLVLNNRNISKIKPSHFYLSDVFSKHGKTLLASYGFEYYNTNLLKVKLI